MLALAEDQHRTEARQELMMMRALRLTVPACFDDKARGPFKDHEAELLRTIRGEQPQ